MRAIALVVLMLTSVGAHAYVGPGLGLGVIGAVLGGVLAVVLAIAGIVWYPIKRLVKRSRTASEDPPKTEPDGKSDDELERTNEA